MKKPDRTHLDKEMMHKRLESFKETMKKAIMLGLFPDLPHDKFEFIGNGSLGGARLALLSRDMREEAEKIYKKMTYIELSVSNLFYNEFTSALFLPHTDMTQFPTVLKMLNKSQGNS